MVHSFRRTFQNAQAMGRDVGVTGIPVIRAQYSNPSVRTKNLTFGSARTRFSGAMGVKRTVSTWGGLMVVVSQPDNKTSKNTHITPIQRRSHTARKLNCDRIISAPEGSAKRDAPAVNGWCAWWSQSCNGLWPDANTRSPRVAWPSHLWAGLVRTPIRARTE